MRILPTKGTGIFRRDESRRGRSPVSQRALGIYCENGGAHLQGALKERNERDDLDT